VSWCFSRQIPKIYQNLLTPITVPSPSICMKRTLQSLYLIFFDMVRAMQNANTLITSPANGSNDPMARSGMPSLPKITVKLRVRRPTSLASSQTSAEEEPLFMASRSARKHYRSLSPISNRAPRKKSRQSESSAKKRDDDPAHENLAWDIINREISEWQTVCQTGRPSWWSPVSKWTQGGARSTWQEEVRAIPPWRMNLDHGHRPGQRFDNQRRAVTDSYLADDRNVQDLAHLIAIQLLGACFTLPPEHISGYKSPAYNCFDTLSLSEMPDSKLISSLRMHTEARYSPSFGHQARNTSPAYRWQGAHDGNSPSRSREHSSGNQSPDIKTSKKSSRRQRIHRALHVTDGSATECFMESHSSLYEMTDVLPAAAMTAWNLLNGGTGPDPKAESFTAPDGSIKSCPSTPGGIDFQPLHTSRLASEIFHGHTVDALQDYGDLRVSTRPNSQGLQPFIRSEPHHIYIQPVKELVVKRWQNFRRRVDPARRGPEVISVSASSRSTAAEGSTGSPRLSSDGKERRRQARERGDIHNSGIECNSHHDTPISGVDSGVASPDHMDHPSLDFKHTNTLGVADAIANAFVDSDLTTAVSLSLTPPNSQTSSSLPSPLAASTSSLSSKTDSGYFIGPSTGSSKPLQAPPTFSARRHGQRGQRKSMLSEVCTPEDVEEERNAFSAIGSPLPSPREEFDSGAAGELPSQIPKLDMVEEAIPIRKPRPENLTHVQGKMSFLVWPGPVGRFGDQV
jgi:hypothetical protein